MDHDNPALIVRSTKRAPLKHFAGRRTRSVADSETAGQEVPRTAGAWWLVLPTVAIGLAASG